MCKKGGIGRQGSHLLSKGFVAKLKELGTFVIMTIYNVM
jgi:hypothetical protein